MSELTKLITELAQNKPGFKEAQAVARTVHRVGDMLEQMRVRAGLNQAELGKHLGISPARVSQLESGNLRDAPSLKMLLRFAQACGETVAIEASGERAAAEDPPAQDYRLDAIAAELAAMRAEIAQFRQLRFAQPMSDPVGTELAQLRGDIADLRASILDRRSSSILPRSGARIHGVAKVDMPIKSSSTRHGDYLMGNITDQTMQGLELAMQSVLTASGCTAVDVNAAKPRVTKDAVSFTMTIK